MGRKRELSVFDAIDELETEDRQADGKRQKQQKADQRRAQEVQQQTQIYQHLVEGRILMQRAIVKTKTAKETETLTTTVTTTTTTAPSVPSTTFRDTCNELLEQLLGARRRLSGIGNSEGEDNYYKDMISSSSSTTLSETLEEEHVQHREQWKHILNQRHKSLRLHSGVTTAKSSQQFRVMDASFWEQVESTVEYETLRLNNTSNDKDASTSTILDDSKVYQQLLKDFVSNHHAQQSGTDAATAAAERLRVAQRKANKEKNKQVDRRASKGRKLRYKEIPKLVNFTFPLSRPTTATSSNLHQDEYFQSLFGGAAVTAPQGKKR